MCAWKADLRRETGDGSDADGPTPGPAADHSLEQDLALDKERDDGAEECDAFDECGENQRSGLDRASRFRLTSHTFDRRTTDAADADAGADGRETSRETRTDQRQTLVVVRCRLRNRGEHWNDFHCVLRTVVR